MKPPDPRKTPEIDVAHTARLARLRLSPEEAASLPEQLAAIIAFADLLPEADAGDEPGAAMPGALCNVLREDRPEASLTQAQALDAAPSRQDGYITIPKMFE